MQIIAKRKVRNGLGILFVRCFFFFLICCFARFPCNLQQFLVGKLPFQRHCNILDFKPLLFHDMQHVGAQTLILDGFCERSFRACLGLGFMQDWFRIGIVFTGWVCSPASLATTAGSGYWFLWRFVAACWFEFMVCSLQWQAPATQQLLFPKDSRKV